MAWGFSLFLSSAFWSLQCLSHGTPCGVPCLLSPGTVSRVHLVFPEPFLSLRGGTWLTISKNSNSHSTGCFLRFLFSQGLHFTFSLAGFFEELLIHQAYLKTSYSLLWNSYPQSSFVFSNFRDVAGYLFSLNQEYSMTTYRETFSEISFRSLAFSEHAEDFYLEVWLNIKEFWEYRRSSDFIS